MAHTVVTYITDILRQKGKIKEQVMVMSLVVVGFAKCCMPAGMRGIGALIAKFVSFFFRCARMRNHHFVLVRVNTL